MATPTQTDIDNLEEAIRSGVLTVSQGGKTLTYRSTDEMRAVVARMKLELGGSSAVAKRVTVVKASRRRR